MAGAKERCRPVGVSLGWRGGSFCLLKVDESEKVWKETKVRTSINLEKH